jgi:hypothetical protein
VTRKPDSREAGTALVAALLFAIAILALTASVLVSNEALVRQDRYFTAAQQAHATAESGVHFVVGRLESDLRHLLTQGATFEDTLRGAGGAASRFLASVVPAITDGTDNDLDGLIDEDDEGDILELTSTGSFDRVTKTVRVTLVPRYRVPWLTSSVYIGDPNADVVLSGSALVVSGAAVRIDGTPTGTTAVGIGVAGEPRFVAEQIDAKVLANIIGNPQVAEVATQDLQALVEQGARAADILLASDDVQKPDRPGAWGKLPAPAVLYGAGDIKIASGSSGVGLLVVDGHLELTGGFEWIGVVIVRGGVTMSGGGSGKRIIGALLVDDQMRTDDVTTTKLEGTGTIDLLYSPEAIQLVRANFTTTYMITNWREGPNPEDTKP